MAEQPTELWQFSLEEVGTHLATGGISPVELTRACLARTEALGPTLNATTNILGDQALESARRAEREITGGTYRGPLHGVPIGIKDLADVAGTPTTVGSRAFDGHVATRDSEVVRQLKQAGAIIIAKLNCDEMCFHVTGAISRFGVGLNPWNTDRVSGGSSSGSGIAVATGMVFGALGSDTGGSIRIPASACGIVGVKPTYGRVSLDGIRLLAPTFDSPGPMARTTMDALLLLQAMVNPADEGRMREANRLAHLANDPEHRLEGLRVGVPSNYFFDDLDVSIERAVRNGIDSLASLGAELVALELPSLPSIVESHRGILTLEAHSTIMRVTGGDLSKVGAPVRERLSNLMASGLADGEDPAAALGRFRAMRDDALAAYHATVGTVDVLVAPALRRSPVAVADALTDFDWMAQLARPFNGTHQPVVCLPCGMANDGMPVGMQIVAAKYRERTALRVALAYETTESAPKNMWPPDFEPAVG